MTKSSLFNINTCDSAGSSKLTNRISVDEEISNDATLAAIRYLLVKDKKLDSGKARLAFCSKDGASLGDTFKWGLYHALVSDKETDEDSKDTPKSKKSELSTVNVYDVYLKVPKSNPRELSKQAQDLLDSKLDMDLVKNKPELITATLKELASNYDHDKFKAEDGGNVVSASSMSENQWDDVLRNTHFLNGHRIVFSKDESGKSVFQRIDRAPYSAFSIKARTISALEKGDKSIKLEEKYQIPRYIVTDNSYVNVFETASLLSSSVASSSFSQTDIEASAGGSMFGVSASAKAGFSESESSALASSNSSSTRNMNITYNFPRAILHLDARCLELTPECQTALKTVKDKKSLLQFHHDFGHFFATNVQLGGKLYASEQFTSSEKGDSSNKVNAMKASASVSVSGYGMQASASASHEEQKSGSETSNSSHMQKTLTWEAQGGDTILCNNPPKWCSTVKPFSNWRIVNQKDVMSLSSFISTFPGYADIMDRFEGIENGTDKPVACSFSLKAKAQDRVSANQYYAIRRTTERTSTGKSSFPLEAVLEHYTSYIMNRVQSSHANKDSATTFLTQFKEQVKSGGYTVGFTEYVGIGEWNEDCKFEVDIPSHPGQQPELQLNVPYHLRSATGQYVAVDTTGTYTIDGFQSGNFKLLFNQTLISQPTFNQPLTSQPPCKVPFGYLFYTGKMNRASHFMFRKVGSPEEKGKVTNSLEVELWYCEFGTPKFIVEVFDGDNRTLLLGSTGQQEWFTKKTSAHLEYIRE